MEKEPLLSSKWYDRLKPVAQFILPALATFYLSMAPLWGLPKQEEVAATIVAVNTLLGVVLMVSSASFNNSDAKYDGELTQTGVDDDTGLPNLQMVLTRDPAELMDKKTVRLRIPSK